jgi:transcriptional regulator with XRE-family HTH domain
MIENSDDPNPTFKVVCNIADALEVTLDELRRNEDDSINNRKK